MSLQQPPSKEGFKVDVQTPARFGPQDYLLEFNPPCLVRYYAVKHLDASLFGMHALGGGGGGGGARLRPRPGVCLAGVADRCKSTWCFQGAETCTLWPTGLPPTVQPTLPG